MNTTTNYSKRKRKVKNALVDIDDVSTDPGPNNINWMNAAKIKLKQRESKLITIRFQLLHKVIVSSIQQYTTENADAFEHVQKIHINVDRMENENHLAYNNLIGLNINNIINACNQSITRQLSNWEGCKKKNKTINTFTEYFQISRSWWDVRKQNIISKHILIPISYIINQFAQIAAKEFFANRFFALQRLYQAYLSTRTLVNVVEAKIELPNTRALFLIPAQTFLMTKMENLKFVSRSPRIHGIASTKARADILRSLIGQYNISKFQFQSQLLALHCEVDNYKYEKKTQQFKNSTLNTNNNYIQQPIVNIKHI